MLLIPGSAASVSVEKVGNDVNLSTFGTLSFVNGSDFAIAINGTTVDTQYQQLNVVGQVKLTGVDLALSGIFTPPSLQQFVIVNNDGNDPGNRHLQWLAGRDCF